MPPEGSRNRELAWAAASGAMQIALGLTVLIGWLLRAPGLVAPIPSLSGLPWQAGVVFLISGAGVLAAISPRHRRLCRASALALVVLGLAGLVQGAAGHPLAPADAVRWFGRGVALPHVARPLASLAIVCAGTVLWLVTRPGGRNSLVLGHSLTLLLMFVGALGVVGELSGLGRIHGLDWEPVLLAGVGFLILSVGLLALLNRRGLDDSYSDGTAERIGFIAGAIVLVVGGSGVLGGVALMLPQAVSGLDGALTSALNARNVRLETSVRAAWTEASEFANQPLRLEAMARLDSHPGDAAARDEIVTIARHGVVSGLRAVAFHDVHGRTVAQAGSFAASPELSIDLPMAPGARLMWAGGEAVLRAAVPMVLNGRVVGSLESETALPAEVFDRRPDALGRTVDYAVCALNAAGRVDCFPMRSSGWRPIVDLAPVQDGQAIPVMHPLHGERGILNLRDYRGTRIIGAAAPLPDLGVGAVLKIDSDDFYGPIVASLRPLVYLLPLAGLGAILLLRLQALPLIRRLTGEIARRAAAEAEIERARSELAEITANLGEGVYMLDPQGRIGFANAEAERLLDWSVAELLGRDAHALLHARLPDGRVIPAEDCPVHGVVRRGEPVRDAQAWLQRRDGSLLPVSLVATPILHDGVVHGAVVAFSDRREALEAEQAGQRLTRALRLVSECNGALVRIKDEQALLDAICALMVTTGGYLMTWIGFPEHDEARTVRPVAQSGDRDGYLGRIRVSWGDDAFGRGPTGAAVRERTTQVNQNCLTNPNMAPWRDAALERGYQASIALPLLAGGDALGVLTVYAVEAEAFNDDEVELLEQLAGDLAYGIAALRTEVARARAVAEHAAVEERYRLVLDNAADAVLVSDPQGQVVYANQQAAEMLGWRVDELVGLRAASLLATAEGTSGEGLFARIRDAGRLRVETALRRRDGGTVPVEANAVLLPDGNDYVACRDVSERNRYLSEMEHMATHDPLTGLANRALLLDRIDQALIHARQDGARVAAMLLDLDRFKVVNDSLTHGTGDALLREVARRLQACVREGDTVSRLGGDEFMVVMTGASSDDAVVSLAGEILAAVSRPLRAAGHELVITASLGIALFPRDGESAVTLMRNADMAMYRAKEGGRNAFEFYAEDMNRRMVERLELESGLRRALEDGEFELHYQPKVSLASARVVGAEALLRWRHPVHGMVSPASFIPLAEETGLIQPIGDWVIDAACVQLRAWDDAGLEPLQVAVNVSARQFQQTALATTVGEALRRHGVDPARLELEVTESALMINPDRTLALLNEIKAVGVGISLDDFGTGYSSLNYLKRFPIDSLKIDQSFVRDIPGDADDATIARLVIALGHDLGQVVIAEGVETEAQYDFLRRHRCDQMQGYLYSAPLPPAEFEALVRSGRRLAAAATAV